MSPQNVLVGFDGTVRVTDFGIAKALGNSSRTSAGVLKGNMGYLAPEQLRFEEPDRRSDLFSLGVTLYEMLTGHRLYPNTSGFDGTRRILTEPAPDIGEERNDVPAELCELLFELLAKERNSRPATAAEVASRLEGILAALISDEGSMTVADYMDAHFADARQKQRAELAAHLTRIESGPAPLRPADSSSSIKKRLTVRASLGLTLGSTLAAVIVIGFRLWSARGQDASVRRPDATAMADHQQQTAMEEPREESDRGIAEPHRRFRLDVRASPGDLGRQDPEQGGPSQGGPSKCAPPPHGRPGDPSQRGNPALRSVRSVTCAAF